MSTQAQPLELVTAQSGLDAATSDSLKTAFTPLFEKAQEWKARVDALNVTDVNQTREMKLARESRLALKDIRCESKRKHDELKADSLRRGKAIDGMHNIILYLVEPLEKRLLDMEQFAERKEQARLDEQFHERKKALAYYGYEFSEKNDALTNEQILSTLSLIRDASEEFFQSTLDTAKKLSESRQREAERVAKEKADRELAEAQERERVRLENERLKAEAAAREEQMRKERETAKAAADKAEAERKAALAKAEAEKRAALEAAQKKAREEQAVRDAAALKAIREQEAELARRDAAAKVERERAKAEQDRLAKKAREEKAAREKAERELAEQKRREEAARVEADAKAKAEKDAAEEARRKAEVAPDKIKLETYLLEIITADAPFMATAAGTAALTAIVANLKKFEIEAKKSISKL